MKHYKKQLSAYLHQELPNGDRQKIAEHLLQCAGCRKEHDEIKLGAVLASYLPRADAPENLWNEIENVLDKKKTPTISLTRQVSFFNSRGFLTITAVLLVTFGLMTVIYFGLFRNESPSVAKNDSVLPPNKLNERLIPDLLAWNVETIAGTPKIGNSHGNGKLAVGEFLETDAHSSAKIQVADIGDVEIAPNSRVKLVKTQSTEHRLSLERGILKAKIIAPPRLFIVDTPSAEAVDLGCAYTLEVDKHGNTKLHVTSGYVALERDGREAIIPAAAICLTKRGKGIGTPFFETVSSAYQKALWQIDFENGANAPLQIILKESRSADSLTLWHLLTRVPKDEREKVFDALLVFVKLPPGVTKEGILKLDKKMLEAWHGEMSGLWF